MTKHNHLILKYGSLVIWLIVIFLFSNQIATNSSALSGSIVEAIKPWFQGTPESALTFLVRKSAHIGLYFILGLLTYSIASEYKVSARRQILYSWMFVIVYAISDEIHQMFVPGRSGEVGDVLIDSFAGLLGIVVCYYLLVRFKRKS